MAAGKKSKSQEAYSARYKSTLFAQNRRRKLERILKMQPNNEQVKMAIKDIHYRRKTPNTNTWSHSNKRIAQVLKSWTGYFNKDILSSNVKLVADALHGLPSINTPFIDNTVQSKNMFALGTRLKERGVFVNTNATQL